MKIDCDSENRDCSVGLEFHVVVGARDGKKFPANR